MPKLRKNETKAKTAEPTADVAWFNARAKDRGTSISQMSVEITGHKDLIARSLNGKRELKPGDIIGIASVLGVPLAAIFAKLGHTVPAFKVPLVGVVNEHARIIFAETLPDGPARFVPSPNDRGDLQAIQAETDGTKLGIYHGTIFYYEKATGVRLDAVNRLAVIEVGELEAPILGTISSNAQGMGTIVLLGGFETIKSAQLKSATPVVWQHNK